MWGKNCAGDKLTSECYRKDVFIVLGCVWEAVIKYIRVSVQCFGEAVTCFFHIHKKE